MPPPIFGINSHSTNSYSAYTHVYGCRDTDKVFQAVIEARKRTDEGDERALQLLKDSQADIKKIVRLLPLYETTEVDRLDSRLLCGDSTLKSSVVCLVLLLAS